MDVRLCRAIADYEVGDYAAAIAGFSAFLRVDPGNPQAGRCRMMAAQAEAVAEFYLGCDGPPN